MFLEALQMFPYKIQFLQYQTEESMVERLATRQIQLASIRNIVPSFRYGFFSDETNFHLSGYVNKQNERFLANNQLHAQQLQSKSVEKGLCGVLQVEIEGKEV